ncbi:DUF2171 domain-containing protein [Methylocella sp.]|uniref:DUF2171 domain-containing protein n=1 Tax=Methylocella sp. TaxID=1978226 RepID=UPI0037839C2C
MIDVERSSSHSHAIAALFDTREEAEAAAADLMQAGVAPSRVLVTGEEHLADDPPREDGKPGFWEALKELFLPDEDRRAYAEGLRRGGFMVSVRPLEHEYQRAVDILDRAGAVDIDERETYWRREGWTGRLGGAAAAPLPSTHAASVAAASTGTRAAAPASTPGTDAEAASRLAAAQASQIVAHMDVVGSDGVRIGAVDHLEGDGSIELENENGAPDEPRHHVPLAWVDHVDLKVHLNRGGEDARSAW